MAILKREEEKFSKTDDTDKGPGDKRVSCAPCSTSQDTIPMGKSWSLIIALLLLL